MVSRSTAVAIRLLASATAVAGIGRSRETLDNAVAGEHAAVDREVSAHHEGTHGSILLGQYSGFVGQVSLVLATVDKNQACVSAVVFVAFVGRIGPPAATAEA